MQMAALLAGLSDTTGVRAIPRKHGPSRAELEKLEKSKARRKMQKLSRKRNRK